MKNYTALKIYEFKFARDSVFLPLKKKQIMEKINTEKSFFPDSRQFVTISFLLLKKIKSRVSNAN